MIFILLLRDETLWKWVCCYCTGGIHRLRLGIAFPIGLLTGQAADICSYILQMEAVDSHQGVVIHSFYSLKCLSAFKELGPGDPNASGWVGNENQYGMTAPKQA